MGEPLTIDGAAALEAGFMARVAASVARADGFAATGRLRRRPRRDEDFPADFADEVRRLLLAEGLLSGEVPDRLPRGARALWSVRRWPLFGRPALLLAAGVRHPFRALALSLPAAPLPPGEALEILPSERGAPVSAVVLSTSGWAGPLPAGATEAELWLVEPAPGGGFRLASGPAAPLPAHFTLESEEELVRRAARHTAGRRAELILAGLCADRVAAETGVPLPLVELAFREAAARDEFLRLREEEGTLVLRRA
jgi:hypothetical protein